LRAAMDRANAGAWLAYARTRRRIMSVTALVDGVVFLILVLASATLLYTISRPLAQVRGAILAMREGQPLDRSRIESPYLEIKAIADTLEDTSTELRRREEELRLQTEKAMRASRHKSDFLAKMSHELRTPLNAIIGFSDLLIEQETTIAPAKRRAFLDNVAGSAKHLLTMINDLLDLARIESGKMKMVMADVDLRTTIAHSVASTQPLFVRKQQEVEVLLPDEPMLVRADAGRIEQVLLNLLSNANKFTPAGQTIVVRSAPEERMWRIEIADRGIGIRAEDQERIFEEFEQVGTHAAGTGLGLALAKRFVEAHGGDIGVESRMGGGAVFRVRLPRG
jgi:signal transduction histidine kinase